MSGIKSPSASEDEEDDGRLVPDCSPSSIDADLPCDEEDFVVAVEATSVPFCRRCSVEKQVEPDATGCAKTSDVSWDAGDKLESFKNSSVPSPTSGLRTRKRSTFRRPALLLESIDESPLIASLKLAVGGRSCDNCKSIRQVTRRISDLGDLRLLSTFYQRSPVLPLSPKVRGFKN
jgi:hypothetical protein